MKPQSPKSAPRRRQLPTGGAPRRSGRGRQRERAINQSAEACVPAWAVHVACRRTPIKDNLEHCRANAEAEREDPPPRRTRKVKQQPDQHRCRQRHQHGGIAEFGQCDEPSRQSADSVSRGKSGPIIEGEASIQVNGRGTKPSVGERAGLFSCVCTYCARNEEWRIFTMMTPLSIVKA